MHANRRECERLVFTVSTVFSLVLSMSLSVSTPANCEIENRRGCVLELRGGAQRSLYFNSSPYLIRPDFWDGVPKVSAEVAANQRWDIQKLVKVSQLVHMRKRKCAAVRSAADRNLPETSAAFRSPIERVWV